jgi:hypothetical protein
MTEYHVPGTAYLWLFIFEIRPDKKTTFTVRIKTEYLLKFKQQIHRIKRIILLLTIAKITKFFDILCYRYNFYCIKFWKLLPIHEQHIWLPSSISTIVWLSCTFGYPMHIWLHLPAYCMYCKNVYLVYFQKHIEKWLPWRSTLPASWVKDFYSLDIICCYAKKLHQNHFRTIGTTGTYRNMCVWVHRFGHFENLPLFCKQLHRTRNSTVFI